jgi:hypothetical protein
VTTPDERYPTAIPLDCSVDIPATVIAFRQGPRGITRDGNCYVVQGGQFDFALLIDRVLYRYHGVTPA